MTSESTQAAIEMYAYHGQLGLKRTDLTYCSVVQDEAHPNVWSSNKVFAIKAQTVEQSNELMRDLKVVFGDLSYRHFVIDPLTPEPFAAYLALNNYVVHATMLQMVLSGGVTSMKPLPEARMRPVVSAADWVELRKLVLTDHAEGARTSIALGEEVTDGIVAGYQAKADQCQFFLAELAGELCAYGSGTNGPKGMGMVEDLFTLPRFRGQGLASKMISHCVDFCRERGAGKILIGSHASELPKNLYYRLGFQPAFLTREMHAENG